MSSLESSGLLNGFLAIFAIFISFIQLKEFLSKEENVPYGQHKTLRFYLKYFLAKILLKFAKKREETPDNVVDKLLVFSEKDEMPIDAVNFNSCSDNGQIFLLAAQRRKHGLFCVLCALKVPEYSDKLLFLPVFPSTTLYQTADEKKILEYYSVSGIKIKPVVPKKEYRLEYNGKMIVDASHGKEVNVQLSAVFRSNLPAFNFFTSLSEEARCEGMALEPWTRQYFKNLKRHPQTHYEQFGKVDGVAMIDGKEYSLKCNGLRDRTFGPKRDWREFERYVLHFIHLCDGNAISVEVISMTGRFRRLVVGFVTNVKDNINIPIDTCSMDLNSFDRQSPTDNYEFDFVANNESYHVKVKCHTHANYYMGEQMESRIIEKWCNYEVNGVHGWGCTEWAYRSENPNSKN